jgi:hypothetical protein
MRSMPRLLALGAGVSVFALAAHVGLQQAARVGIEKQLAAAGPGLRHGAVTLDTLSGRASIADLAFERDGVRLTVGRVVLPTPYAMVAPALAAGDLTIDAISIETAAGTVKVPKLDVTGTSNSRDEVMAVFDLNASTPLSARLAALSATAASMPELTIESRAGDAGSSSAIYRDVRIAGLSAGVIRSMAASGGAFQGSGKDESTVRGVYGPFTAGEIDLPLIARFYLERSEGAPGELKTAYGSVSLDGFAGTISRAGKDQARFAAARMAGKGFKLRPVAEPLLPLAREFAGRKQEDLSEEDRRRLVNGIVDFYDSMSIESMEASDVTVEGASGEGKGKIARIAFTGAQVGKPNEVRVENLDVTAKEGYGRVGLISHSGWSYKTTLAALKEAFGKPGASPADVNPRAFMPELGTLTIRDVDLDVPDAKGRESDAKAPNIKIGLKGFELQAIEPLMGVPTSLRMSTDRLTMPIPPGDKKDGLKDLAAMGYKDLDLSSAIDARWSEGTGDLSLNQVSVQGVNMGGITLKGTIGNIAKDVFTGDATTAQIALLGATVKQASLMVENKGLFEKALEYQARGSKKSPEQLRKELAAAAQVGVPAMLGNGANAKQIATALAKFVAKPGRLTVSAKSRDPGGLGLADFGAAGGDPRALLEAVTITATAE